ncbi:MAG: PAS domain-containing protein, partial [Alphaproteobacteria bacterium]|nr:PAS domain-containing protein [Alphaproteobacteria bacterium]
MLKATFDRSRLAVELLRRSEERYRRLVELSPDAIMLHDRDGITFLNPA